VCVDVETNGIDPERHDAVEISWWNLTSGERGTFIPAHNVREILAAASVEALEKNRYIERGLARPDRHDNGAELTRMWETFGGSIAELLDTPLDQVPPVRPKPIFAAVNPGFDAAFVSKAFARGLDSELALDERPWDYHLRDLGSYAAKAFDLPLDHPPLRFKDICAALGVPIGDHTAEGDVTALGQCFLALAPELVTPPPLVPTTSAPTEEP